MHFSTWEGGRHMNGREWEKKHLDSCHNNLKIQFPIKLQSS